MPHSGLDRFLANKCRNILQKNPGTQVLAKDMTVLFRDGETLKKIDGGYIVRNVIDHGPEEDIRFSFEVSKDWCETWIYCESNQEPVLVNYWPF